MAENPYDRKVTCTFTANDLLMFIKKEGYGVCVSMLGEEVLQWLDSNQEKGIVVTGQVCVGCKEPATKFIPNLGYFSCDKHEKFITKSGF
jgi:hypothetical protein